MADAGDRQRGHVERITTVAKVRWLIGGESGVYCRHGCAMVMPQGSSPTWMVLMTFCAATSMTDTSFDTPLVTSKCFSSGVKAMCQTLWPTSRYFLTSWLT